MCFSKLNLSCKSVLYAVAFLFSFQVHSADKVRVALGDVVSVETLGIIIALERAKERGVDYKLTSFSIEELAIQALITGHADIGIGSPYALIQKTRKPLRSIFQVTRSVFFPVAKIEYKDWKELDGVPIVFHGRGSGTEAFGHVMARLNGIEFGPVSYVAGSGHRIISMMNGHIEASVVDLASKNKLLSMAGDRFHTLPGLSEWPSDELAFASQDWLAGNSEQAGVIVEELLRFWREINADPAVVEKERRKRGLLADLPQEELAEVIPFFEEAVEAGLYHPSGGTPAVVQADFEFFVLAGQLEGDPKALKVDDFWDFGPLDAARKKLAN